MQWKLAVEAILRIKGGLFPALDALAQCEFRLDGLVGRASFREDLCPCFRGNVLVLNKEPILDGSPLERMAVSGENRIIHHAGNKNPSGGEIRMLGCQQCLSARWLSYLSIHQGNQKGNATSTVTESSARVGRTREGQMAAFRARLHS